MSDPVDKPLPARAKSSRFQKSRPRMDADIAARQGDITRLAFVHLGGRDAAIEFLNSPDAKLSARPIDLAMESAEGYARVERAILRARLQ